MKRLLYIFMWSCLIFGLGSCDQDIDYPYNGKDRIFFQCFTYNSYNQVRTYSDSLVLSFGLVPDSITIDTAKIVVEYMGKSSETERTYYVSVIKDSTTAVEGVHHGVISHEQKFRPNKLTDTIRIAIYRENLSTSFTHPEIIRLDLQLEPSPDFDLGIEKGIKKKLLMNNYMSEPVWWKGNFSTYLGYFHPKKWKILISFNKAFANQKTCPYTINNEGDVYREGLRNYLDKVPTYDDETGKRLYMYSMEDEE